MRGTISLREVETIENRTEKAKAVKSFQKALKWTK
jgi:hypothetical protein